MHKTEEGCLLYELGTWSEYSGVRVECIVLGLDCTKRILPSLSINTVTNIPTIISLVTYY
jgi:hypothetical protein